MKHLKRVAVLIALAVALPVLHGHGEEPKKLDDALTKELGGLMKSKLENAQKVLEGVVVKDFDKIAKSADELIAISKKAEWKVVKTDNYELYSNEFRRAADEMSKQAKAKNLDGAALAYVELTLSCVRCHKHVREAR